MTLTKDDWVEIYSALESKKLALVNGYFGESDPDCNIEGWVRHVRDILGKIGPDGEKMVAPEVSLPEEVWVLSIDHRHGTDTHVYKTRDAAEQSLYTWVCEWWSELGKDVPMPDDHNEAIRMYFERRADEGAQINPAEVQG